MKSGFAGLVCVLAVFTGSVALADGAPNLKAFSYRVEVPADQASCDHAQSPVADRFATATGTQVTGVSCTQSKPFIDAGQTFDTAVVIVNYLAGSEVVPYQAIMGGREFMGVSSNTSGAFLAYADCLKELNAETAIFTAQTSLVAVAGHCDVATDVVMPGYALTVEGFGVPQKRLYAYAEDTNYYNAPEVLQAITTAIGQSGGTVVYGDSSRLFYYSQYGVDVTVAEVGFFSVTDQCVSQQAEAQTIFVNAGLTAVSALCVASSDQDPVRGHLTVVAGGMSMANSNSGYGSARYAAFDDCINDRGRVIQNETNSGAKILGAICKPNDDDSAFVMELYFDNK
jgi:hypothetical protein